MPRTPRAVLTIGALLVVAGCSRSTEVSSQATTTTQALAVSPSSTSSTQPALTTQPVPTTTDAMPDSERDVLHQELVAARQRWTAAALPTYEYRYAIECFCSEIDITARVLDHRLINTPEAFIDSPFYERTVDDWFDTLETAVETAAVMTAEFDPELGFPIELYIDEDVNTFDEEVGMSIGVLVPVADPIERWFTDEYACATTMARGTPDQSALIAFEFGGDFVPVAGPIPVTELPYSKFEFGSDLFHSWCLDVIDGSEPGPVVTATWTITGGEVYLTFASATDATGQFEDLTVTTPDGGEVDLGDVTIHAAAWGIA